MSPFSSLSSLSVGALETLVQPCTVANTDEGEYYTFRNWGRTYACNPNRVFCPRSRNECALILELAKREGRRVRAVGVGHSPSDLACTKDFMVRMNGMSRVIEVDCEKKTVTAEPGLLMSQLHVVLAQYGLALSIVGSISAESVGGIIATATHGSGAGFPCIASYVLSLDLLLASGECVRCSRTENKDLFLATVGGLGATGIILSATLLLEPAFRLKDVQNMAPFKEVVDNLEYIVDSAEHTRFWWFVATDTIRVSKPNRTNEPKNIFGSYFWDILLGHHFVQLLLFLALLFPNMTTVTARFVAWLKSTPTVNIDESWNVFNVDCLYYQYTTEWAVPLSKASTTLRALRTWLRSEILDPHGLRPHFPIEIRFSKKDEFWLSPANADDGSWEDVTCWIGLTQYRPYNTNVPYRALFKNFQRILYEHGGRPHWAKAHPLRPAHLRSRYVRFEDFVALVRRVDPQGVFANEYVRRHIFGEVGEDHVGERVFKERDI